MARGRGRGRIGVAAANGGGRGRGRGRGRGGGSVAQFLAPHTERSANRVADAGAGAEYNPEIHQLRQNLKGSRKREGDLGQWYAQLAADYKGAQKTGSAALKSVEDTTTKQLGEASQRGSADLASLGANDSAFASLVGGPKDTAGLAKIAQAGAAASAARVDQAKLPISEQANFTARLGGDRTAARMQGIETRQAEKARREKIRSDLGAVRKEKGHARVTKRDEIRESDRGYSQELKQLALSRREAAAQEQQAAADQALAQIESAQNARQDAIGNRFEKQKIGISARSQRATARHYRQEGKSGGMSPSERRGIKEGRSNAAATARSLVRQRGKPIKTDREWAELEDAVRMESEVSPAEARNAVAGLRGEAKAKAGRKYKRLSRDPSPHGLGR